MSADKMREEFEAWECDACTGPLTDPMWLMRDSLSPEDYGIVQVQRNWEAWQASRAALEVNLPDDPYTLPSDEVSNENYWANKVSSEMLFACRKAIEAAGLKVKP